MKITLPPVGYPIVGVRYPASIIYGPSGRNITLPEPRRYVEKGRDRNHREVRFGSVVVFDRDLRIAERIVASGQLAVLAFIVVAVVVIAGILWAPIKLARLIHDHEEDIISVALAPLGALDRAIGSDRYYGFRAAFAAFWQKLVAA